MFRGAAKNELEEIEAEVRGLGTLGFNHLAQSDKSADDDASVASESDGDQRPFELQKKEQKWLRRAMSKIQHNQGVIDNLLSSSQSVLQDAPKECQPQLFKFGPPRPPVTAIPVRPIRQSQGFGGPP